MFPYKMVLDIIDLLQTGDLSFDQARDLIDQKLRFERYRRAIEARYSGLYVFVAAGKIFAGTDFNAMSRLVTASSGRVYYCERIP
jgi:hypothetical protein